MRKSGEVVKPWLIRQKQACEKEFIDSLQLLSDRHEASLQLLRICSEFEDATASVGGRVPGALRSGLLRKLTRKMSDKFGERHAAED